MPLLGGVRGERPATMLRTVTIDQKTYAEVWDDKPVYVAMTRRGRVGAPANRQNQPGAPLRRSLVRLLRRSGWNDLAHWTCRAHRSRVPFRTGGASWAPRASNARIALRTGRSHGTNITLRSNGARVSFGASRTGRASISFRANWPRITLGTSGSNRTGATGRSDRTGLADWSSRSRRTGVTLCTGGADISLGTGWPGKQLDSLDVGGSGSTKGVHDRSAGDAVPDQQ